jgi:outer membrane protein assembly factor BamC
MMLRIATSASLLVLLLASAGCSSWKDFTADNIVSDKRVDYKKERQAENALEIPPDLTKVGAASDAAGLDAPISGSATYSDFVEQKASRGGSRVGSGQVLPSSESIELKRDGSRRWLVVQASPEAVWFRVVDFWQQNGILLQEQDPGTGVMRTAWVENRADIKSDFVTDTVRTFLDGLYTASTRDQFRVRVEKGERAGTTEIYLTHFGMQEEVKTGVTGTSEQTVWVHRPTDPELEAEMLRRIMVYLGVAEKKSQQLVAQKGAQATQPKAQLVNAGGRAELQIDEEFGRAWRLVGLTLDRVGFAVEDRDRSRGVYYVRYQDPAAGDKGSSGFLSKLKFWGDSKVDATSRYQVRLREAGGSTRVDILDDKGVEDRSETALRILTLLKEQIR